MNRGATGASRARDGLWRLLDVFAEATFTDLTHGFAPGIPHDPGLPDEARTALVDFDSPYRARVIRHELVGQWGTHIDAPLHFDPQGSALDALPIRQMLLPLVVLDIHKRAQANPDASVSLADIEAWEAGEGMIPPGSFVALRTDWSTRWAEPEAFLNVGDDGVAHRPGWSAEVLSLLVEQRQIAAIGHETPDTDPAAAVSQNGDYVLERYILGSGRWQIELLTALSEVPQAGALLLAAWPKVIGGAGFPVRAIAIHAGEGD
jgi:kynurenine formamidase